MSKTSHRRLPELLLDVRDGDMLSVREDVEDSRIPVNAESPSGLTALFYAVRGQWHRIAQYLIEQGADVNPPLPRHPSLLNLAENLDDKEMAGILKKAGAVVKPPRQLANDPATLPRWPTMIDFKTAEHPLYMAAVEDDQAAFAKLVSKVSQKRLQSLLTEASIEHEVEFGLALIPCIRNINYDREDAANPLWEAAASGCLPLVRALLEAGARNNLMSALENAAMGGHADVVTYLIEPAISDAKSALREAASAERDEFQSLIDRVADKAVKDGYTRVAEAFLPHCSTKAAHRVTRGIEQWHRRHGEDAAPDRFCTASGRGETGEDLEPPDWMEESAARGLNAALQEIVTTAANKSESVRSRLDSIKFLATMGRDASSCVPILERLVNDDNERIRKAAQKTLQAVRGHG